MSVVLSRAVAALASFTLLLLPCTSLAATTDAAGPLAAKAAPPVDKAVLRHVDQRLASMKKALAITETQQPSWHGFAEVMRSNALGLAKMSEERNRRIDTMNAVANIESYAALAGRQADDMNALSAAFHIVYGVLTPEQQHAADALFRNEARQNAAKRKR